MKSYGFARSILMWIELFAWLAVAAGAFGTMYALGSSNIATLMVAIPAIISGLSTVALMRVGGAIFDIAENTSGTAGSLENVLTKQRAAEDSARARQAGIQPKQPPALRKPSIEDEVIKTHRGERIIRSYRGYLAVGDIHADVPAAERAIDRALDVK